MSSGVHEVRLTSRHRGPELHVMGHGDAPFLPSFATRETSNGFAAGLTYIKSPVPESLISALGGKEAYAQVAKRMTSRCGSFYEARDAQEQMVLDAMKTHALESGRAMGRTVGWDGADKQQADAFIAEARLDALQEGGGKEVRFDVQGTYPASSAEKRAEERAEKRREEFMRERRAPRYIYMHTRSHLRRLNTKVGDAHQELCITGLIARRLSQVTQDIRE